MGLLTSDGHVHFLFSYVHKYGNRASVLIYLSGILTFAVFVSEQWSERTYFSDNALLPGLVNREFVMTSQSESLLKVLQQETKKSNGRIPFERLDHEFRQIGLEVYQQNFTLSYPLRDRPELHGTNVYAILRAPRAPSTEALVLSTPFRGDGDPRGSTLPSICLMISLAKYFAGKNYWAKDIIFLVGDKDLLGVQAWLNAYHTTATIGALSSSLLSGSSGLIQAAVNLELHGTQMSQIDIKIEGLNGQLPNLDLFNVAVELCTRESVTPAFHKFSHPYAGPEFDVWKQYATTVLAMMRSQAVSYPTGAHGLFQKFAIQSITLAGDEKKSSQSERAHSSVRLLQVGRVVEGIFRSLNNLLERFNRSYWFYLLPSTRRYLSIGYYMIPFALITSPLILTALRGYIRLSYGERLDQHSDDSRQSHDDSQRTQSAEVVATVDPQPASLDDGIPFWFFCHLTGLILVSIPFATFVMQQHASAISMIGTLSTESLVYSAIISFHAVLIVSPIFRLSAHKKLAQQVICLLNAALLLSAISLINISLALALSLICSPVLCVVNQPVRRAGRLRTVVHKLLLLIIHPISINYFCCLTMSICAHSQVSLLEHLCRAYEEQRTAMLSAIDDWCIYGHWMYLLTSAFLFPVWLQAWSSA